jgi:hypothetical protein
MVPDTDEELEEIDTTSWAPKRIYQDTRSKELNTAVQRSFSSIFLENSLMDRSPNNPTNTISEKEETRGSNIRKPLQNIENKTKDWSRAWKNPSPELKMPKQKKEDHFLDLKCRQLELEIQLTQRKITLADLEITKFRANNPEISEN